MAQQTFVSTDDNALLQCYGAIRDMGLRGQVSAILLDGPPGTGKTFLGRTIARHLGGAYIPMQAFPGCSRRDLLFDETLATPSDPLGKGALLQAIEASRLGPTVLHFDEWDKADASIDAFLLNFLSEGYIFIPQLGELRADSLNLLVVITKNDQRDVTAPLMRRCRCVYMEWPSVALETIILRNELPWLSEEACSVLVDTANRLRANPEVFKAPSVSEIMRLAADLGDPALQHASAADVGKYYIAAVAPYPRDRKHIEQSPLFLGSRLKSAYSSLSIPDLSHQGAKLFLSSHGR